MKRDGNGADGGGVFVVAVVGSGWRTFLTHQPGEHLALREHIAAIQPGRVLLLAAMVSGGVNRPAIRERKC